MDTAEMMCPGSPAPLDGLFHWPLVGAVRG